MISEMEGAADGRGGDGETARKDGKSSLYEPLCDAESAVDDSEVRLDEVETVGMVKVG